MRYDKGECLRSDAERVSNGVAANQSQEALGDQLKDLHVLANRFGLYDAADWLKDLLSHRVRYERDFGETLDVRRIECEQHPLRIVPSITFKSDPRWGEQHRHNWPDTSFNEAEPGTDRHDPGRC